MLEVNIFNFSKNIYNKKLKVEFISFIRGEKKFKNIDQLKKQIDKDILVSKKELNKKMSKEHINLPKTVFSMKANLPAKSQI